jgi:hypothetical protein
LFGGAAGDRGSDVVLLDSAGLAAQTGMSRAALEDALSLLVACGVVVPEPNEAAGEGTEFGDAEGRTRELLGGPVAVRARLAADLLLPVPTADAVDWPFVLDTLRGNAAALLIAWAFAELLRRPDRYASVPRALLQAHSLYSEGMVKRALGVLLRSRIVERTAQNAYRFTDRALGRAIEIDRRPAEARDPRSLPRVTAPGSDSSLSATTANMELVAFMAGGLPLALPRDTTIEIETELDGKPVRLRLRFPSS